MVQLRCLVNAKLRRSDLRLSHLSRRIKKSRIDQNSFYKETPACGRHLIAIGTSKCCIMNRQIWIGDSKHRPMFISDSLIDNRQETRDQGCEIETFGS